jgi:hypothetical protein
MADSGTYDPATVSRRAKIAEQMWMDAGKRPVRHWSEGLANIADSAVAGLMLGKVDREEKEGQKASREAIASMLGGGAPASAAPVQSPPMAPQGPDGGVIDRIISAESGGNPNAKNPMSSATGAGQFIDSTWLQTIKAARPDLAQGNNDAALLAMRTDPSLSREMTDAYAKQNAGVLAQAGQQATPGNTYLAHFAGPGGATKVLGADPSMRVAELLGPAAVKANPFLQNMTAGDLRAWADKKMGGAQPAAAAPAAPPQGGDTRAKIAAMLQNPNPYVQKMGAQLAQGFIQKNILGSEETNETKEYNRAVQQGYKGTLLDYQKELKEAGKPVTNINQQQESEFQKGAGKFYAERYGEMIKGASDAKELMTDIGSLRDLGSRINTGKTAEVMAALGPYAEALGVKIDGLGEMQAYNAIVSKLAPRMRVAGSGATSDFEMQNFLKALPGLGKTPQGNEIIANTLEAVQQHKLASGDIANRVMSGEITRQDGEKELKALGDPLAMWRKNKGGLPTNPASNNGPAPPATPAQAAPQSVERKTIGGKNYIKRDGQWFEE